MLSLWIVRHGETDWNREGRIQGWSDIPLSEIGLNQSQRLAAQLPGIPFAAMYSSDLRRALTTAEQLASAVGIDCHPDTRLRERGFGGAEGLTREEVTDQFPQGAPAQEPLGSLSRRAKSFLDDVTKHRAGRVLAVSHGGFIRNLLKLLGQQDVPPLANTSVTRLSWDGTQWRPDVVSWAGHLSVEEQRNTRPQYREPTG